MLVLSGMLGAAHPSEAASGQATLTGTLGGPGHATIYPGGLETTPDGGVVVADTGNDRVVKFSPSGAVVWSVGAPGRGTGQFQDPRDIGVDSTTSSPEYGDVYVADNGNGRVVLLSSAGAWLKTFNGVSGARLGGPIGIGVGGPGDGSNPGPFVYVADGVQQRIHVFTAAGAQLAVYGSNGACALSRVRDAAPDAEGDIFVANYLKDDIVEFHADGTCALSWGAAGTGPGQFKNPYGVTIATDPDRPGGAGEAVFVADSNNNRVQEFTTAGAFIAAIGGPGSGPGAFTQLRRVAVGAAGSVWAADLWGYRIEQWTRSASGYTYAVTIPNPVVPPPLTSTQTFNSPHGIAVDGSGNLWIADTTNQRFVHMQPSGTSGTVLGACGQRGFQAGQENWPRGIAYDPNTGDLWVADTKQSNLQVFSPTCTPMGNFGSFGTGVGQLDWPFAIAIRASDKTGWVADTMNNRVVVYSLTTHTAIGAYGSLGSGTGQFDRPAGISIDPHNGDILVADQENNRVVELGDAGGGMVTWVAAYTDGLAGPQGVAADSSGRIYIADTNNNRVVTLTSGGVPTDVLTPPSGSMFKLPAALSVDQSNNLFVADTGNDRVVEYSTGP